MIIMVIKYDSYTRNGKLFSNWEVQGIRNDFKNGGYNNVISAATDIVYEYHVLFECRIYLFLPTIYILSNHL